MVEVCLAVRPGAGDADAVADAIRHHDPDARLTAVWGGDPHLRPLAPTGTFWADLALTDPTGLGWERLLVAAGARRTALAKALRYLSSRPSPTTLVLSVGDVAVTGDVGRALLGLGSSTAQVAVIRRQRPPAIGDGLGPDDDELGVLGLVAPGAIALAAGADRIAGRLADALTLAPPGRSAGATIDSAFDGSRPAHLTSVAAAGEPPVDGEIVLADVSALDRDEPWSLAVARPPRHPISNDPTLRTLLTRSGSQWAGPDSPTALPGGLEADAAIVGLVRDAVDDWRSRGLPLPPEPFSEAAAFRRWLEEPGDPWEPDVGRYWVRWHELRPDLGLAFPQPAGRDFPRFREWAESRWYVDGESALVRSGAGAMRPAWSDVSRVPGINLIGYHSYAKSIGDVVRRIGHALDAAGVAHAAIDYHRSGSPRSATPPPTTTDVSFDTNLCVVNADQFPNLAADYGEVLLGGRHTIGYWFWEVEQIPDSFREAIGLVDEIWAGSDFVADAFRAITDTPVRVVPVPVSEPDVPELAREYFGLPDDRFVFLVTFDYLSVAERKNPIGAIEAFRSAFPEQRPDGPMLVVKSLNADRRPQHHERAVIAAAGREDIVLIDRHATRGEQMALTRMADCLVSLHRSEGLGLHLMEAMWLRTATIATRYSGNLQFCTDENCALVDAGRSRVIDGDGYLPSGAVWAEPDLAHAARLMQRMVADEAWRSGLIDAGRAAMEAQPSLAEAGRTIATICETARRGGTR